MAKKSFYVEIRTKGNPTWNWFEKAHARLYYEIQRVIFETGEMNAQTMQEILKASNYNLNKLANAITSEPIKTVGGVAVGIGNISKFPKNELGQGYWEAFEVGFKPGTTNKLVPAGSFTDGKPYPGVTYGEGRWQVGRGDYTFFDKKKPKKIVNPLEYIKIGRREIKAHIRQQITKLMKEYRLNAR